MFDFIGHPNLTLVLPLVSFLPLTLVLPLVSFLPLTLVLPLVSFLPLEFLQCNEPVDHKGNSTAR